MMRLTLRTLLAYLDDILEPAHAKEIGEKLNESSLASSLVSRIREVMRRRRLTAPTLSGPGVGIDPNSVAEYLDNTLTPDGVADVEKICLESDVHLAEVAACHQILTLALGEPVEVPLQTRERMYGLGPSAAKMTVAPAAVTVGAASSNELPSEALNAVLNQAESLKPAAVVRTVTRESAAVPARPVVPEYLRRRSPWKSILSFAAVIAVIGGWAALVLQWSPFGGGGKTPSAGDGERPKSSAVAANDKESSKADVAALDRVDSEEPVAVPSREADRRPTRTPAARTPVDIAETRGPQANDEPIDLPPPAEPDESGGAYRRPTRTAAAAATTGAAEATTAAKSAPAAEAPATVAPAPPAMYVSPKGIALHFVPREQRWFVLPRRSLIHPDDSLAVPESFEGAIEFEDGKGLMTLPGHTALRWRGPNEAAATVVDLQCGQIVLKAASAAETATLKVAVLIYGDLWRVELPQGTKVGIDVIPPEPTKFEVPPGKGEYAGGIYVASGTATVIDPYGRQSQIAGLGWMKLPVKPPAEGDDKRSEASIPLVNVPRWLVPASKSLVEQQQERTNANMFEKAFKIEEPVDLSLPAWAEDTNPNRALMATTTLGLIEAYRPLVNVLKRTNHDEARRAAITALRTWLPLNPQNRELLKAELGQVYSDEEADAVYRLLWGFDADDARDPATSRLLVDWLHNADTSICELAIFNIFRLTGKTHEYRASLKPLQRKSALNLWEQQLKRDGALLPARDK